ncbi:MAG TPA: cytochrome P460 family protein [Gammaproteobacteria bacterium]|nr:cytochrome P460 family protein [Gammaproteobacteria bacterium]
MKAPTGTRLYRHALTAILAGGSLALVLNACGTAGTMPQIASEKEGPPYGGQASVSYAQSLWNAMNNARLVGDQAIHTVPYAGQEPHGAVLEALYSKVSVGGIAGVAGHEGKVIVKKNYNGDGITNEKVANHPAKYLSSITVMFKREAGYDPEDNNWFWAKYKPDGTVATDDQGMKLAGRVAKGTGQGCISCHSKHRDTDFQFNKSDFVNSK